MQVLIIFKFLEDKDVFQKFYSSHFSRRLIQHQYSTDMETNMISKLKEVHSAAVLLALGGAGSTSRPIPTIQHPPPPSMTPWV